MFKWTKLLLITAIWIIPRVGLTQLWLDDRQSSEGDGVKLGKSMVMHPGIGVEGGYDTNPLRMDSSVLGSGRLRLTSYFDFATVSGRRTIKDRGAANAQLPKVKFRLGLAGYYDWYLSSLEVIKNQNNLGLDTSLNLILFPLGAVSFYTNIAYLRSQQPYETSYDAHSHHTLNPQLGIKITPNKGTLSFDLSYKLRLLLFEDDSVAEKFNKASNKIEFDISWKLLPKTAIISKIEFSPVVYLDSQSVNSSSRPLRGKVGIQGLITDRFGLLLLLGYGASFYKRGDTFTGFLVMGELKFYVTPFANIRIGGQRDFVDSFYSNYYIKNGGYLAYSQMFGGVFLATLKGDVYYRQYANDDGSALTNVTVSTSDRGDIWTTASLLLEYRVVKWLSIHASTQLQWLKSDFKYTHTLTSGASVIDGVDYHRFMVIGGVRGHY